MDTLTQLWMPILLTAVLIFIASSLIHMLFKWHNTDYNKLANEDEVRAALRVTSPAPAQYVLPHCTDMKEMQGEAMLKKFNEGPVAYVTIRASGPPTMGKALGLWFAYSVLIASIAGCLALSAYAGKSNAQAAGQLVGAVSFLTYVGGSVQMGIWMGKPWVSVGKDALDGAIYALISGLTFALLWR